MIIKSRLSWPGRELQKLAYAPITLPTGYGHVEAPCMLRGRK